MLDGVQFPLIRPRDIPVKVQDLISGVEQVATMMASLVGMTARRSRVVLRGIWTAFSLDQGGGSRRRPVGLWSASDRDLHT